MPRDVCAAAPAHPIRPPSSSGDTQVSNSSNHPTNGGPTVSHTGVASSMQADKQACAQDLTSLPPSVLDSGTLSVSQVASQTKVLTEQESAELTEHQKKATDLQRELDFPNAPKKPLTKQDMVEMTEHRNKVMALKREMDFPNAPKKPLTKQDIVEMTEHRNKVMALKRELDFPPKPKPLSKQEVNALIKERNSRPIDHGLSGLSDAAKAQVIEMRERKRERWMAQQNSGPTPASLNRSAPSSPSVSTEEALH